MKTNRFTSIVFSATDNKRKTFFVKKLVQQLFFICSYLFFGSGFLQAQPCPVTTCLPLHTTSVNLSTIPECGVGTVSIQGDIQNGQEDCKNGPLNNCHEFIMFRPTGSVTQQFTLEVGQGAGCNGELDATYSFIDGVCDTLSNGGSNTSIVFTFPANIDTITLFLCLNSGAFVTMCDLCATPPPCDLLPICNLDPIDTTGCSVPAPFTDPADVFTNIPSCMGTTLILDYEDQGDTLFCTAPAGVNFIRTYTLYFLDAAGDTSEFRTCPQSIEVTPVFPTVVCQDITVQLNSIGMVSITPQQVLDTSSLGCGGTFAVNPNSFTCANLGANTVTLTVTDDCGNTATCTATVTVQTTTPTADAGPPSADVCITQTYTASATTSNGTILWTSSGSGSFNGTEITEDATYTPSMADYTAGTVTLTLTVTGTCTTAVDMIILNFIQCECEVVLICDEDVLRNDSTINGCTAASAPPILTPTNSVFDTMSIGGVDCNILYASTTNTTGTLCPDGITVTYTYYGWHDDDNDGIRDPEEQQYSCAEVFTIVDVTAPGITCPPSLTIQCTASTLPANTGTATATDNCDSAPTITSSDVTVGGGCPQEYIITRTWIATDDCGNSSSCTQTITVDDSLAPQITCPASLTIECTASTLPANTGTATATDNCDSTPTITSSDITVGGGCPQEYIITRTWIATDDCGNSSSCTQTITVDDSLAPQITCPASITIECSASTLPANTGTATATDNCDGTPAITSSDVTVGGGCPQEYIITRTWIATDDCGNSSSCTQTITVDDSMAPQITCPASITIECTASTLPANTGTATATDNCDNIPTITSSDVTVAGNCPQEYIITRTWRATDDCGNSSTCNQTITVDDSTGPQITCPASLTIECTDSTLPATTGTATATDNCDGTPTITSSDVTVGGGCPQEYVILRTWTATDDCNNSSTCLQTINVDDSAPPVVDCPDDLTLECSDTTDYPEVILEWIENVSATDNCDDSVTIMNDYDGVTIPDFSCEGGLVITFTATDDCGNSSTCSITITKPCFDLDTWVYIEGAAAHQNGFNTYTLPMRTTLNNLRVLPGQTLVDPFIGIKYTPPGQPYNIAPWNYFGTEGDGYDSGGDPMMGSAGYPSTVVDWVLVSLRNNANDQLNTADCQAAALLHKDGTVEFVEPLSCCNVNENTTYYVVIEHRNHLIVMSHVRVSWVNHKLTYNFRNQQSYVDDPFMFGIYARQKQIISGSFAMFGGNGNQIGNGDTDLNINDRSFWEGENSEVGEYRRADYNLNSDTNLNDRVLWERNNGRFTSVPRN